MIFISSPRLRVELAPPGESPNDTYRFNRAGYISDIILDGFVHFCSSEPRNLWHPCTGGRGLCCEFLADYSREVEPGAYFPKLGVGLFPRKEEPHIFYMRYSNIREFPVHIDVKKNKAVFETEAIPCLGIALEMEKTISVHDNVLTMETEAHNVGDRKILSREYCHNFLSLDGMALSPDYKIELPNLPDFGTDPQSDVNHKPCNWRGDGHGFAISKDSTAISHIPVDLSGLSMSDCFTWSLIHKGAGSRVTGREYFRPDGMEIWAADHIISPEIFYLLDLSPGEKKSWRRTWTFETEHPFN